MTISQALKSAITKLAASNITDDIPRLEAEILLSNIFKKPREFLLTHDECELTKSQITNYKLLIKKRLKHMPIAYLTGEKEFYGLKFKVNKNVLIPRPETELMVEEALKLAARSPQPVTLIDVGTGSGCLIITLAKQITSGKFFAIDVSAKALSLAKQNSRTHNVHKNIKFLKGNLLKPVLKNWKSEIACPGSTTRNWRLVILANLPYLAPTQIKKSFTIKCEPKIALNGGKDGLDLYRKLAGQIKKMTGVKITLLCEIGQLQAEAIKKIFSFAQKLQIKKDLSGLNRLVIITIS